MTTARDEYQAELDEAAQGALDSPDPWRLQRALVGWDIVAVVKDEVVKVASADTKRIAQVIIDLWNVH